MKQEMSRNLPAHPLPQTWEPWVKFKVYHVYWKGFRKVGRPAIIKLDGTIQYL